jgi:hypothetical protein
MASATTQSDGGQNGRGAESRGWGLVIFAAVVLAWIGTFNLMYGAGEIAHRHAVLATPRYMFGTLHSWGWITLIVGILELLAAAGVLLGNQLARWFGVAVVGLAALAQILSIFAAPWWSLAIIAANLIALYGLYVHASSESADDFLFDIDFLLSGIDRGTWQS